MKRFLFFWLILWAGMSNASAQSLPALPLPSAPPLAAKSWLLMDANSGQILAAHNPNERIEPASLTKMMTAYLTFAALRDGRLKMDQKLLVSVHAWRTGGSRMFLLPNTRVPVSELLRGMIVQSGNDAAVTLAEGIAGSEGVFAQMMNHEAKRLGMKNSHFADATGLPHIQHYSTAHDLGLLTQALIRDFPQYYALFRIKEFRYNHITQPNRNRLLWLDPYVDGVKTGHTEEAGYCLIASGKRHGMRLISVVLGTETNRLRSSESQKLLNYGFQFYESHRLYRKDQLVGQFTVWKGRARTVKIGVAHDLFITIPKGSYTHVKARLVSKQPLLAPVRAGQVVGKIEITLNGKPLANRPLIALKNVRVANIFGRAWDSMRLWFNQ